MTPHIEAKKGDIADCVLLPGDPLRAKWLAETYLSDIHCYNRVRNMFGYTGTYKGQRISVQGSGMGIPSLSIYVHELLNYYDVKTVMRIGSCGGMQSSLSLGDVILAMTASTDSAINRQKFGGIDFAPAADWQLLNTAFQLSQERNLPVHVGGIMSGDRFYTDDPEYLSEIMRHGVLAVEMETNALYTLAAHHEARALTLLTVSDMLDGSGDMAPEERERGLQAMAELALDTAIAKG